MKPSSGLSITAMKFYERERIRRIAELEETAKACKLMLSDESVTTHLVREKPSAEQMQTAWKEWWKAFWKAREQWRKM